MIFFFRISLWIRKMSFSSFRNRKTQNWKSGSCGTEKLTKYWKFKWLQLNDAQIRSQITNNWNLNSIFATKRVSRTNQNEKLSLDLGNWNMDCELQTKYFSFFDPFDSWKKVHHNLYLDIFAIPLFCIILNGCGISWLSKFWLVPDTQNQCRWN